MYLRFWLLTARVAWSCIDMLVPVFTTYVIAFWSDSWDWFKAENWHKLYFKQSLKLIQFLTEMNHDFMWFIQKYLPFYTCNLSCTALSLGVGDAIQYRYVWFGRFWALEWVLSMNFDLNRIMVLLLLGHLLIFYLF